MSYFQSIGARSQIRSSTIADSCAPQVSTGQVWQAISTGLATCTVRCCWGSQRTVLQVRKLHLPVLACMQHRHLHSWVMCSQYSLVCTEHCI